MWKLQGGSYIPGFSGQAYGAGLQRDVTKTRQDQARKAAELEKYQSKRSSLGKWAGNIVGAGVGVGLGAMGMGPLGLTIGKTLGAGLGSRLGSSKMISGEGPSMSPGAGTGLLGSTYEQLGEAKGGIDEAMRGQAYGAGAAQLMSGLTGAAGDKLGAAFGKTGLGMNLKSGYGKMMAEKFGKNIGQALPGAEQVTDLTGTGLGRGFDFGDMPGQLTEDRSWFDKAVGAMQRQQGGYMQGYQEGGPTDMEMMRHTESLREKYGLEKPEVSDWQQSASEKKYGALKSSEESERESSRLRALAELGGMGHAESAGEAEDIYQQSLGDMDRGNLKSLLGLVQGATGTQESRIAKGRSYDLSPYQKLMSDEQNMMVNQINDLRNKDYFTKKREKDFISQYDSKWHEPLDIGMQMGGMMPGGVSNALPYQQGGSISPYNLGGSVTQQPMAYQLGGLLKYKRSPMMG